MTKTLTLCQILCYHTIQFKGKSNEPILRIWQKKLILGPIVACLAQIWTPIFLWILSLLVTIHCSKLSSYVILRNFFFLFLNFTSSRCPTLINQTWKNGETPHFGTNLGHLGPNLGHHFFLGQIWVIIKQNLNSKIKKINSSSIR